LCSAAHTAPAGLSTCKEPVGAALLPACRHYQDFLQAAVGDILGTDPAEALSAQPRPDLEAPGTFEATGANQPTTGGLLSGDQLLEPEGLPTPAHKEGPSTPGWRVLFTDKRLDCRLSVDDCSPGMELCTATLQVRRGSCLVPCLQKHANPALRSAQMSLVQRSAGCPDAVRAFHLGR
jgi:hypothetical protein